MTLVAASGNGEQPEVLAVRALRTAARMLADKLDLEIAELCRDTADRIDRIRAGRGEGLQPQREKACQKELCMRAPALAAVFGHTPGGHRITNALALEGFRSVARISAMSDEDLLEIRNIGASSLSHIRARTSERPANASTDRSRADPTVPNRRSAP